jgi:hypothetical protein
MADAQQLVACHMLRVSLEGMLSLNYNGFEVLNTHFVKVAIAASLAIAFESRPSLRDLLAAAVGFQVDKIGTSKVVNRQWDDLANRNACHWENACPHPCTSAFDVELRVVTEDNNNTRWLHIDSDAAKMLAAMGKPKTTIASQTFKTVVRFARTKRNISVQAVRSTVSGW